MVYRLSSYFIFTEIVYEHNIDSVGWRMTADVACSVSSITILIKILDMQLVSAESDLLGASISAPMYGVIKSIHAALEDTDLR